MSEASSPSRRFWRPRYQAVAVTPERHALSYRHEDLEKVRTWLRDRISARPDIVNYALIDNHTDTYVLRSEAHEEGVVE
jgi:hypothetical protein